jgi:murein L,D-transpeptidase YcbB/YkuD
MGVFIDRSAGVSASFASLLILLSGVRAPAAHAAGAPLPAPTAEEVRARLSSIGVPAYVERTARGRERWKAVQRFYQGRGYRLAWVAAGRISRQAASLLRAAAGADGDGLDAAPYVALAAQGPAVRRASAGDWADPALDLDLHITYALLRYADEMTAGRVDPRGAANLWALNPAPADTVAWLARAVQAGAAAQAEIVPAHPQYQGLRRELARYRALAQAGEWPPVEGGPMLKPGARSARVAALRARLIAGGELAADDVDTPPRDDIAAAVARDGAARPPLYDAALVAAVKQFQARHGLKADGFLDKDTVAELNVSAAERARQIELNLERWRWLPHDLGERYVLVNIPTFELQGYDHGRRTIQMRVVAGTAGETPTPVFAQPMTHVVFSPYWNVPPGIAREEIAPAAWHNRTYLVRNNMEVLKGSRVVDPGSVDLGDPTLQFRQRPGAGNSLGRVKFLLPNPYNVYLHDTPSRKLFAEVQRDYSHGCVRVQQPFELAQWVLEGSGWTPGRIRAAMDGGEEMHVRLPRPIPVYVAYFTVWIDDDGRAQFRPDIYRHDAAHEPLLSPVPADPPAPKIAATTPAVLALAGY